MGKFSEALRSEAGSYEETEWSGQLGTHDVALYAKPLTPADMTKLSRRHPNFASSPSTEGMVDLMIMKCRDADDSAAFDKGDKPVMMRISTNKLSDVFHALFGEQMTDYTEDDLDDDVKN